MKPTRKPILLTLLLSSLISITTGCGKVTQNTTKQLPAELMKFSPTQDQLAIAQQSARGVAEFQEGQDSERVTADSQIVDEYQLCLTAYCLNGHLEKALVALANRFLAEKKYAYIRLAEKHNYYGNTTVIRMENKKGKGFVIISTSTPLFSGSLDLETPILFGGMLYAWGPNTSSYIGGAGIRLDLRARALQAIAADRSGVSYCHIGLGAAPVCASRGW